MYRFNYHKASSLAEASQLRSGADDGVFLAGGMTLIPTMKQRLAAPTDVVDLAGIEGLNGITVGDTVTIGAMTPHADVAASAAVRGAIPALADLAGRIGDAHVRNRGTIGGSIANSDPAADYPAAVVALNATVHTDRRDIAGEDFFLDLFETALSNRGRSSLRWSSRSRRGRPTQSSRTPPRATPSSASWSRSSTAPCAWV